MALLRDPWGCHHRRRRADYEFTAIPAPYPLPRDLRGSAPCVLRVANYGRLVFNGKIIGMRGDPLPPPSYPPPAYPAAHRPVF